MTRVKLYSDTAERWFANAIDALGGVCERQPDGLMSVEGVLEEQMIELAQEYGAEYFSID